MPATPKLSETGLRKASGHVYWARCRNPEAVRSRHHGISNEESDWGRLPLISPKPVSGSFPSGRRSGCYLLESDGQLDHFDGSMLIRTYRDLNKASGHLTHMRSPEAERNSPI